MNRNKFVCTVKRRTLEGKMSHFFTFCQFSGASVPCWELPSLGEMRASNLVATRSRDFVHFTSRNLCRVYPSAYRIDSSNYNPQPMWNCGCQLGQSSFFVISYIDTFALLSATLHAPIYPNIYTDWMLHHRRWSPNMYHVCDKNVRGILSCQRWSLSIQTIFMPFSGTCTTVLWVVSFYLLPK